jgi:peroxiredoxin
MAIFSNKFIRSLPRWMMTVACTICAIQSFAQGTDNSKAKLEWVPQHLLSLLHAPEVHTELRLKSEQIETLEKLFEKTDGPWFRARNLATRERYLAVAEQERWIREQLVTVFNEDQIKRLDQLERRAQSARMLLRPDVILSLDIIPSQRQALEELFANNERIAAAAEAAIRRGREDAELSQKHKEARQGEDAAAIKILDQKQKTAVFALLGPSFDLTRLKRIYPKAPEVVGISEWINSSGESIKGLKGKVIAVHFYAFACSNCKENLPIYNDLWEEFKGEDFAMIGIHTPEIDAERKVDSVRGNAASDGIEYPVAIDDKKGAWNAWGNTMWPTIYLIDKEGYIRFWWPGELKWKGATGDEIVRKNIRELLDESSVKF